MPKICYVERTFGESNLKIVEKANEIIADYTAQGYKLTLRQLYYQFVSRDLIENTVRSYKRLGSIINDGRLAGLIDWDAIEDRTRNLQALAHWDSPAEIVQSCAAQFRIDKWDSQPHRVEVWIEKEALAGVFEVVCRQYDVPFLSCRGYTSQSEMWSAAQRLSTYTERGQQFIILHFGDHDPSGIDMTRDIEDRLKLFGCDLELRRLALNMAQVRKYAPPPNPAKDTDARFAGYIKAFGHQSWELDALEPSVLADLVSQEIDDLLDHDSWDEAGKRQQEGRRVLTATAKKMGS